MTRRSETPRYPKPVIGLLGGPGSGKSTIAAIFAELGCGVIDADKLAHDAIQTQSVRDELRSWWGDAAFDPADAVDRQAVGRIVFGNQDELRKLEGLIHPVVAARRKTLRDQFFSDPRIVVVVEDCPLLLETGLDSACDRLVYIDCPFEARLARVMDSRGWDAEELKRREERQIPLDIKRQSADDEISNERDPAHLREQVVRVLQKAIDSSRQA